MFVLATALQAELNIFDFQACILEEEAEFQAQLRPTISVALGKFFLFFPSELKLLDL